MVRITALMDDQESENKALVSEHGLSFYVEYEDMKFLFDCGASDSPIYNAHKLGIELGGLDGVILSHSHYDHSAGYRDLIEMGLGSQVLYTGHIGDGKIFVYSLDNVVKIRTGEEGAAALADVE